MGIKQALQKSISSQISKEISLEIPPNPSLGNYALPCFKLAVKAEELQKTLKLPKFIEKTEVKGPYLNFFISKTYLAETTIKEILTKKSRYGAGSKKTEKALVEHTSINPNASPHMGRARNAIIGDSIVRLLKFNGYKVQTHYFVNDIGKQIAMLVLACKNKKPTFHELLDYYVKFNAKIQQNPQLEKDVFSILKKLENGDKRTISNFKKIVNICVKGQTKILNELDINFDKFDYESDFLFSKEIRNIVDTLKKTGKLFVDEEGRNAISLEGYNLAMEHPFLPLTRQDGTSLYILRDIAYTKYKINSVNGRNIVILGEDQKLYFQQLKIIMSLLGYKAPESIHYSFILLPSGKMSTRKGEVVLLEDFMQEIKNKAAEEIILRNKKSKKVNSLAKIIGYGALKFAVLKVSPDKNIIFDMNKALSFDGETAPYIQYAFARANSIIKKAKPKKIKYKVLIEPLEQELIFKLSVFPEVVNSSTSALQPHIVANYALELAKLFNEFYHNCRVLDEKDPVKSSRLNLVIATKYTLENALSLLGIDVPEFM